MSESLEVRVIRSVVRNTSNQAKSMDMLTHKAKNLYNATLYEMRKHFFETGKILSAYELIKRFTKENQLDYRSLPAQTAQQTVMLVNKSFKGFFQALKAYKQAPEKFMGKPKLPCYKAKEGNAVAIFTSQQLKVKGSKVCFPKHAGIKPIKLPNNNLTIKQARVVPQTACFIVEFVFERPRQQVETIDGSFLSLDLGVQNFVTALDNQGRSPFIIKGEVLKSANQWYNKLRAKLVSLAMVSNERFNTRAIDRLTLKRNLFVENFMHQASAYITAYCKVHKIQTVIIGHNLYWKQKVRLGRKTNQKFVSIPYSQFIAKLRYKLESVGVSLIETDESYTSKCDHLAYETMEHHIHYAGQRTARGLFKSSTGAVLNADVNGCIGIARKVFGESVIEQIADRGVGLTPLKINVLKQRSCQSHFEFKKVS